MAIIIKPANPNVKYANKTLPADAAPYTGLPPADPNVKYDSNTLPANKVQYVRQPVDQTNLPNLVVLGTLASVVSPFAGVVVSTPTVTGATLANGAVVLPGDVMIKLKLKKTISASTILDGVEVTQHIRRQANRIALEFTIRAKTDQQWIFGQNFLDDIYQKIYLPNTVIYVQNTTLNKLGITQLIVDDGGIETVRGSINIPIVLNFRENIPGQSLII